MIETGAYDRFMPWVECEPETIAPGVDASVTVERASVDAPMWDLIVPCDTVLHL
jgi:hypothetical protein